MQIQIRYSLIAFVCMLAFYSYVPRADALVKDWQQGVSIHPVSATDFGSETMRQSLARAKSAGADYVALVIRYHQPNLYASTMGDGVDTPTDAALVTAVRNARALGLRVMFKVHVDADSGEWRANIFPSDKAAWFSAYGDRIVRLGQIGQREGVEMISLGTEMVRLTSTRSDPANTNHWLGLIGRVRAVYGGKLTYGANSTYYTEDEFANEKYYVGFWPWLDYVSLSPYYSLNYGSNDVATLKRAWHWWNTYDIKPFYDQVKRPILFGEIGYRSLPGAYHDPWNWERSGPVDEQGQANDYEALLSYWNDYPYMQGVYFWNWQSDPNAGGSVDNGYTPQNKKAERVMSTWFGGSLAALPAAIPPAFEVGAGAVAGATVPGGQVTLSVPVKNTGGDASGIVVDMEVYGADGKRIHQQFFDGQPFAAGASRTFETKLVLPTQGRYTLKIGIFSSGWTTMYVWVNDAKSFTATTPNTTRELIVSNPTQGARIAGIARFNAAVTGMELSQYEAFWQVDGDRLNAMSSSGSGDGKEGYVDLSGWSWRGDGPYRITISAKDTSGAPLGSKDLDVFVAR